VEWWLPRARRERRIGNCFFFNEYRVLIKKNSGDWLHNTVNRTVHLKWLVCYAKFTTLFSLRERLPFPLTEVF
jgi:hypothetical protein